MKHLNEAEQRLKLDLYLHFQSTENFTLSALRLSNFQFKV